MKKRKISISTVILIIVFLVGLSVMLYPAVSDYWNTRTQSHAIAEYDEMLNNMDDKQYQKLLKDAKDYNERLKSLYLPLENYKEIEGYERVLDVTGTGIMGYVTIPEINVELPIYHGTSDEVLNVAVGHVQGSTLPIGGKGTHSVISAHRGLPSAKLFSDLDELSEGDIFTITVLNDVLTYEVDKILIVEPEEVDKLNIIDGEDFVTLVTCTPYGINTHRLLVRGKRIDNFNETSVRITSDAVQIEPIIIAPIIAAPILLLSLFFIIRCGKSKKSKGGGINENKEKD